MTQTVLAALLPVVFVVVLGILAAHFRIIGKSSAPVFADFVVRFALPLALLGGVLKISTAAIENGPYLICMAVGLMVPYAIAFCIGRMIFRHGVAECALEALVCAFPSMAYSGLPVLEAVVGTPGILAVIVGNLVTSLIMIPLTLILVQFETASASAGQSTGCLIIHSLGDAIKQPLVWVPVLGTVLALSGIHPPQVLELSFDLIGKAAAGVALFALGLILYGQRLRIDRDIAVNALLKNVAQPSVMLGLALLLRIHGAPLRELFLTGAIPTATAASMLALRYRRYADEAAASTLVSTAGSILTITAAIVIAARLQ